MMNEIFTYCIVIVACLMWAVADRVENIVAFNRSIFSHLDKKFWCKEVSWQYAIKIFKYKVDAWHLSKSAALCLLFALIFVRVDWWHYFIIGGTWNTFFNLFYHRILYR